MNALPVLVLLALAAPASPAWTVEYDEEGVRVEQRDGDSPVQGFRAEATLEAAPEACLAIVASDRFFARTAPHVAEARVVAREGERLRWFYARFDPPFVAARDYTIRVEESEWPSALGRVLQLSWKIDNARGPAPRPGTVRVERSEGAWTFSPVEPGRTLVRYEINADPGGSIPRWVGRRVQIAAILAAYDELRRASGQASPQRRE